MDKKMLITVRINVISSGDMALDKETQKMMEESLVNWFNKVERLSPRIKVGENTVKWEC